MKLCLYYRKRDLKAKIAHIAYYNYNEKECLLLYEIFLRKIKVIKIHSLQV